MAAAPISWGKSEKTKPISVIPASSAVNEKTKPNHYDRDKVAKAHGHIAVQQQLCAFWTSVPLCLCKDLKKQSQFASRGLEILITKP